MKPNEILTLKKQGFGNDAIYQIAAGNLGLFGIAFFGHTRPEPRQHQRAKRILNTIWKRILATN